MDDPLGMGLELATGVDFGPEVRDIVASMTRSGLLLCIWGLNAVIADSAAEADIVVDKVEVRD